MDKKIETASFENTITEDESVDDQKILTLNPNKIILVKKLKGDDKNVIKKPK